ncbi:helicase-related protein [Glacieibacterium sp.]|uniref:helicase-related protein n=1 Tax=Glacieibacterium sp. TaxID=2860237 RepID=UPI003AFF7F75
MSGLLRASVTAVLGPTNTGKTHLAVERMCGHASGMIGFPLRLLAREVYDRVVAIKGEAQVALITGEEKIVPATARYFLCTAESMPDDREVAFVAIDEGQVGADPERGHVFTGRMLHSRGYAETMILGSETLRPLIKRLLPDAEIVTRPRFSTLSYAPPKKLSRLPKRTVIVAFTAAEVYALAEMLRRHKGGAAVVMGSLSPRTRNAQVAMFQSGEVDYLVATDAIGMGLNMDIAHVAFASLGKFDGKRHRRLTTSEMAQIAGRAGRYQKDGTFGVVQLGQQAAQTFEDEEIEAIEQHRFKPLTQLVWRNERLDMNTLPRLIASLEERPRQHELVRADDPIDFAVLKSLAGDPDVVERAHGRARIARLWAACGLPDYRKTGVEQHARLVARVFRHLSEGNGLLPSSWVAAEVAQLDHVTGDIATLSGRIAAARTWTYIAHRPGWLEDAAGWADRTRALEDRLSDALHRGLTQRFVDRRTAVLLKDLKVRGGEQRVAIDADGALSVEDEVIGTLEGFRFTADPLARAGERKLLLAAAERHLPRELARRAEALIASDDTAFAMAFDGGMPPRLLWNGARVAKLRAGRDALNPRIELDRALETVPAPERARVAERLAAWFAVAREKHLAGLARVVALHPNLTPAARGLGVMLVEHMGCMARETVNAQVEALTRADRKALLGAGVRLGVQHVFVADLLRPEPTRWRLALWAVAAGVETLPAPPPAGRVAIEVDPAVLPAFYGVAGFWIVGPQAVRVDMVDRLARAMHGVRAGRAPFVPDANSVASVGMSHDGFARLMRALGYRLRLVDGAAAFAWGGVKAPQPRDVAYNVSPSSPFAALAGMTPRASASHMKGR